MPEREKKIVYFYSSKFADRRATITSSKRMCIVAQSVITAVGMFFFLNFYCFVNSENSIYVRTIVRYLSDEIAYCPSYNGNLYAQKAQTTDGGV